MTTISRTVQSGIYTAGAYGHRPVVPTSPDRLEAAARAVMTRRAAAYVADGAGDQRTVAANREAFTRHRILPRQLTGTHARDLTTTLLGRDLAAPLLYAPVGALELAVRHRRGARGTPRGAEPELARAAARTGLPVVISSQASVPMEDVADALGGTPRWFQLYWPRSAELTRSLVRRAEAIGADAIVLTTDTSTLGWRTRDLDLGHLPFARGEGLAQYLSDPEFRKLSAARAARPAPSSSVPGPRPTLRALSTLASLRRHRATRAHVDTFLDTFSDPTLTWADLARLRELTDLPVLVKGVQTPDDATAALDHGASGVIVSNHGGRQLDNAIASLDALPAIATAVRARTTPHAPVLFDSGIRTGADAFVALALGADAVLLGRPWVYGLALAGAEGVHAVTRHVLAELDITMALAGAATVGDIGRHNLAGREA
ncbi:alpha-hydroxy-acid oxidizing protein [Myceligenerans pegani]|uniref:Alpha-hydroxy-acid oxidizing protein n=1 Tax=Myceligenerans pegani TaxID=2776917 RepID=A0ABR9MUD4_9MICO|nr:alpha-hydroxy-acid oxidizing protein [Myceligenerans sp. TRM 65318]MBE1874992.1 alpha-hydroxy-acid oxidizing protein [Myceligenerans sp. TRM 65318]MBE3017263.1 alpha-hydroxy-acid oxidizing protein [Myceligenerans sp. TRM 65318]